MTDTPVPARASGTVVAGRYLLGEQLGAGGMGVVHRATHIVLGRPVAIKFLHPVLARKREAVERFRIEASTAARLAHPNVVTVIDYREDADGTPFLVMEFVAGRTLRSIIAEGPMTIGRTISLGVQMLGALRAAHAADIVHGDVKSENVLIELRRGDEHVKLVDFGLAHVGRGSSDVAGGTPGYLAPEVILGAPSSPASDLYSVGVILYELLTGAAPFAGTASMEILSRQLRDDLVPPSLRLEGRELPRALEDAVAKALEKDPADRFRDAAAFSEALRAVRVPAGRDADATPVMVMRHDSTSKLRQPNARNRRATR